MGMVALQMTAKEAKHLALVAEETVSLIGALGDLTAFVHGHILSGSCADVDHGVIASLQVMARMSASLYKHEGATLNDFADKLRDLGGEDGVKS